jgi:hypothetical protein
LTAEIEQWDGHVLGKLMQRGSMTVGEIMESLESDQFGFADRPGVGCKWVGARLDREDGRVERVDSLGHHGRWPERGRRSDRTLRCQ